MEAPTTNHTLYINNINEKVKKDALKKMLYMLFSQYGRVAQIIACKGIKMRGQAWVVFHDVNAAANALKGKQGFNFYGKPLKIQFAKEKSHVIARKEGLEIVRVPKRKREQRDGHEAEAAQDAPPVKEARLIVNTVPHRILFAQNLPADITQDTLHNLFAVAPGYREVRLPPGGRGIAFIEFENDIQSTMALRQFNGMQLGEAAVLHLTYSN